MWLCEIAYIPTDGGLPMPRGRNGCVGRIIVGWSMSNKLNATTATDALTAAVQMERVRDHSATSDPKRSRRPSGADTIIRWLN